MDPELHQALMRFQADTQARLGAIEMVLTVMLAKIVCQPGDSAYLDQMEGAIFAVASEIPEGAERTRDALQGLIDKARSCLVYPQ